MSGWVVSSGSAFLNFSSADFIRRLGLGLFIRRQLLVDGFLLFFLGGQGPLFLLLAALLLQDGEQGLGLFGHGLGFRGVAGVQFLFGVIQQGYGPFVNDLVIRTAGGFVGLGSGLRWSWRLGLGQGRTDQPEEPGKG